MSVRWKKAADGRHAKLNNCSLRVFEGDEDCWLFEVWRIREIKPDDPPLPGADGVAPDELTAKRWAKAISKVVGGKR